MILFKKRYELLALAKKHRLPKVYDLLNTIKINNGIELAATDGKLIYINEENFNTSSASSQFFVLCHELLHIIYHHNDELYFPRETFSNKKLLNICQDVVINEYLSKRLGYREDSGVYLDNFSEALMNHHLIYGPILYKGVLTTASLYKYVVNRFKDDNEDHQQLLNDMYSNTSNDLVDPPEEEEENTQATQVNNKVDEETLDEAIENIRDRLKITDSIIDEETKYRNEEAIAGQDDTRDSLTVPTTKKISSKEMINFIEQFIGNNALIKSRHRTYTRPSRRLTLESNLVAPGYKRTSTVKRICVYLDVSGSMDSNLVSTLFNTLKSLYRKVEFDLYTFNHSIYKVDINKASYLSVGGGTDIQTVLDTIKKENQDAAILITDCEDRFSLNGIETNLMMYTNDLQFKSDNKNVQVTYFYN